MRLAVGVVLLTLLSPAAARAQVPTPTPVPEDLGTIEMDVGDEERPPRRPRPNVSAKPQAEVRQAKPKEKAKKKKNAKPIPTPAPAPEGPPAAGAGILPGARPIGVPSFFIERFRIPPFLLPIYQAAGIQYGIRWELLAAINEIETDYGRNLDVSSAGARGWMQFMPATWKAYGTDANRDGVKDPYSPVDAIFAAGRYLKAAGGEKDVRKAVFAYNHADWYVDSVLERARLIGGLPSALVGSLTGLTQGRFPVRGPAAFRDGTIRARRGAPVLAASDGRVVSIGSSRRLGRFVRLRDAYGNELTYARLAPARTGPAPVRKVRLFANPERRGPVVRTAGRRLRRGARIPAGTRLGRVGARRELLFELRPAGRRAPRLDPEPFLDGWRLLARTGLRRRAAGRASVGEVLLMSKDELVRRVLGDERIDLYPCGRRDVRAGLIDRRVLASLAFLAAGGLHPTVSSLRCGRASRTTASGNLSAHPFGNAVDIAAVNGVPIAGHQGPGSIGETVVQRLAELQGALRPDQIISLRRLEGAENTLAMDDHDDHVHVGFGAAGPRLGPKGWNRLAARLGRIENPELRRVKRK